MTAEQQIMIASHAGNGDMLILNMHMLYCLAGCTIIFFLFLFSIISCFGDKFIDWFNEKLEKFSKETQKNYILFIIFTFIISLFSLFFVSCFNNVYPYSKF